ncbi:hypothetical protein ACFQFR_20970 [Streptomyces goshikiensis]
MRESHTRRSPSGISIRAPRPRDAEAAAGRRLTRHATHPATAAAKSVTTAPTETGSASRQSAWWRFARAIETCAPASSTPPEASTAARHRRAARQQTAATTSTAQTAAGATAAAQGGSEPSGSPEAPQCVASRSP